MSRFKADFTVYPIDPNLLAAPVNIEFKNTSTVASAIQDDYTFAVNANDEVITPTQPLSYYTITNIDRVRWDFGDKSYSSDYSFIKNYNFPGLYTVVLSIYSNDLYDTDGTLFHIKSVKTIDVTVQSRMYAWLKLHMSQPHLEALDNSPAFKDLIGSTSQMFDRMYKEIHDVANLMDIKTVAPKFLEYFSDTLNHKKFYAKKVGYAKQIENENKELFLDYDIFSRIEKGIAEEPELELFRQFIIDTAALFKQNGSKHGMEEFFKLYDFMIHVKEKWTQNFGVEEKDALLDDFLMDSSLQKTNNSFKFKGFSVVGFNNSLAQLRSGFNSLIIDNYHFISQHSYPGDVAFGDDCTQTFEINDYTPNIMGIFRSDGRTLDNKSTCLGFDLASACSSGTSGTSGTPTSGNPGDIIITKNKDWSGASRVVAEKVSYKQWQGPQGYVNSVVTMYGLMPKGSDEIAESGINGDTSDDYLWADWKYGVTVPNGIPGVTVASMKKPVFETEVPNIKWSTTGTNYNLIQSEDFSVTTKQDFFVVSRGFLNITKAGYYVFSLETGNTGSGDNTQQVALLSLKHSKKYTLSELETMESMDSITFTRDNTDVVTTIGTTASGTIALYSKKGEYGIIEIRQNEIQEDSGYYYLEPGYYALEVKAAYGSAAEKKLKLYWQAYEATVGNTLVFDNFIQKKIIPKQNFVTIRSNELAIEDTLGKGYAVIPNSLFEGGDIFNVVYYQSANDTNQISGILSSDDKKMQNFEITTRITTEGILDKESGNRISPQKTFLIIFGAEYKKKDLYSNIDDYYALVVNGKKGEISLIHVTHSEEADGPIIHRLNLNKNLTEKDNQQYTIQLLDEDGHAVEFIDGVYYDVMLKVVDGSVSAYYKKNSKFTQAVDNVYKNISQDVTKYVDSDQFEAIFTDVLLSQGDADVETTDWNGNKLSVAVKYSYTAGYGYYGFAVKSSIIKLEKYVAKSYDLVDATLLSTDEKWKTIKPKFLDSRGNKLLKYNSYGVKNKEQTLPPAFAVEITGSYNSLESTLPIDNSLQLITDNSVQALVMSNISASSWGTRFNVVLNKEWTEAHFENASEVMNSVVVQYGNFQQPYVNWLQPEQDNIGYTSYVQAGYYPNLSENAQVLPHAVAVSGAQKTYLTDLSRTSTDNSLLYLSGPMATIINATNSVTFNGLWEEVCPASVSETWVGTKYPNEVFELIYRDKVNKQQVIGVKFKNETIVETLICRYCENTVLWGLFELSFPSYMTEHNEEYDNDTISSTAVSPMRYYAPIGTLNKSNLMLLPPIEMVKRSDVTIQLKGVYAHLDTDSFSLVSKDVYKLNKQNTLEEKYKFKVLCNYFLDVSTSFYGKLEEYNAQQLLDAGTAGSNCDNDQNPNFSDLDDCQAVPNAYYMPKTIASILNYLSQNSSNFELDYTWWNPEALWVKKQTTVVYPENTDENIYSGLNGPKKFYSTTAIVSGGFDITLNEKYPADIGKYVADVRWCVSNVGWDASYAVPSNNADGIGAFDISAYNSIGFKSTSTSKMGYESLVQVGDYLSATLPVETVTVSGKQILHFGSYFQNDNGTAKTLSPYGLFNWFQSHSNPLTDSISEPSRIGWQNTEWNDQFAKCFKVENIYGQISKDYFHINKYWAFFQDKIPTFSTVISVGISNYNCAISPVNTLDSKMVIGVADGVNAFYNVPPIYSYYPKWTKCVNGVYLDNYELPADSYYIKTDTNTGTSYVVLDTQGSTFDYTQVLGKYTKLIVNFYSESLITSESSVEEKLIDNFKNTREINWVTLTEQDSFYKIAMRSADDTLLFTGNSNPYNIIEYNGEKVYQLADKFEFSNNNAFAGGATDNEVVGVNSDSGSIDVMQMIDVAAGNYTITTDVIFDSKIIKEEYQKRFELILKAEMANVKNNDWAMTDYYFVGIGVYDFDIGLGMRSVDPKTGTAQQTYLASFGEFNARNIKVDTWYTLKATVSNTNIKVYFYERGMDPQLVLNYNIDKKYEKLSERYLKGQYETLEAIVSGLSELLITYPDKLGNTVSSKYTYENFKEEFAKTLPINGNYCGFRTYNPYTYVSKVEYSTIVPKQYKWGSTLDVTSKDEILEEIKRDWGMPVNPEIKKYKKTLNFTTYVLINDTLFYKQLRGFVQKYPRPVYDFDTNENKIFVIEKVLPTDAALGMNEWAPGDHTFIWSLETNVHNIATAKDFFSTVPNLVSVTAKGNTLTLSGETSGTSATCTSGTSATSGTGIIGTDTVIEVGDTITLKTACRTVTWPLDGVVSRHDIMLRVFEEGFVKEYTVLIKDKTFYKDEIKSYMNYSQKKLSKVIINDNRLHIIFEDN